MGILTDSYVASFLAAQKATDYAKDLSLDKSQLCVWSTEVETAIVLARNAWGMYAEREKAGDS